jgi:hypothetical protein
MKTSLNALHHQTTDWLRELQFYKDEIKLLQGRLGEVAAKNTAQEVLAQVDHFENKFIILNEQADILKHDVNQVNESVLAHAKANPTHLDEKYVPTATALLNRVSDYSKSVADTRFELNQFLSKTL